MSFWLLGFRPPTSGFWLLASGFQSSFLLLPKVGFRLNLQNKGRLTRDSQGVSLEITESRVTTPLRPRATLKNPLNGKSVTGRRRLTRDTRAPPSHSRFPGRLTRDSQISSPFFRKKSGKIVKISFLDSRDQNKILKNL